MRASLEELKKNYDQQPETRVIDYSLCTRQMRDQKKVENDEYPPFYALIGEWELLISYFWAIFVVQKSAVNLPTENIRTWSINLFLAFRLVPTTRVVRKLLTMLTLCQRPPSLPTTLTIAVTNYDAASLIKITQIRRHPLDENGPII